jgi:hypothetical protein
MRKPEPVDLAGKVFFIVAKARKSDSTATELDAKFRSADDDAVHGFEDHSKITDRSELSGFIRGLNVDEQTDPCVPDVARARRRRSRQLEGSARGGFARPQQPYGVVPDRTPMLADYLEEALSQLGKSFEEFEAPL